MSAQAKTALIVGAGIAGSSLAFHLAKKNYQVTLLDRNAHDEIDIFHNKAVEMSPHFMLNNPRYNSLMIEASKYSYRLVKEFNFSKKNALLEGVVKLYDIGVAERLVKMMAKIDVVKAAFKYLPEDIINKKYSINSKTGIFFKYGGWVSPKKICSALIEHKNIKLIAKSEVKKISYKKNQWFLGCQNLHEHSASNLIFCNSFSLGHVNLFNNLDLKKTRGQVNWIPRQKDTQAKEIISDKGYLIPDVNGVDVIGSTYGRSNDNNQLSEDDFKKNLKAYQRLTGNQLNQKCLPNNGWVGWRAISPDRNPYVGQVLNTSKELTKNPKSLNDLNWHPNLFVNTGYGSRGYTLAPFVSKCLASKIDASQTAEEEDILNYLNPCRGSLKKLGLRKKIFLNSI